MCIRDSHSSFGTKEAHPVPEGASNSSEAGMSAIGNGLLRVGDVVQMEPVAGGKVSAQVPHKPGQFVGV